MNISYILNISESEKARQRNDAVRGDRRTVHRLSIAWFPGEDTGFNDHGLQSPRLVKDDTLPRSSNPEPKKKGFFTERESKLVGDRQVRKARYVHEIKIRPKLRKANESFIVGKTIFKSLKQHLEETELMYVL